MTAVMARRPLLAYILIAYGWTWVVTLPLLLSRRDILVLPVPHQWEALGAFGPFIAAWVVLRATGQGRAFWQRLSRWRLGAGWWAFTLVTPVAFLLLGLFGVALLRGAPPDLGGLAVSRLATASGFLDLLLVGALLQSLGEEPGWRGYMLPALRERRGPLAASLLLFPVWLFWHLPFFLSRPEFGPAQFAGFALGILSASLWFTLLWDATRSALVAVVWHVLLNLTRGVALAISTAVFLAYGLAVTVGAVLIAAWWLRRGVAFRRAGPDAA